MGANIRNLFAKITQSIAQGKSEDEDHKRREFILNILLISSIVLSSVAFSINFVEEKLLGLEVSVPSAIISIPLVLFSVLYLLSRKGFSRFSAYILLSIFFLLATYEIYAWGVDLPSALLTYVLIIVMAGVLVSTSFAFLSTILIALAIAIVGDLQVNQIINPDSYWKSESLSKADFVAFGIIFLIITTVSWLSNREIEKSLERARRSEAELKNERDSLEKTVEERTRELKETQAERVAELYRFAEFGRLSSGIFHDLINPLQAVSLNIEKLKNKSRAEPMKDTSDYVEKAITSAKKLESLVAAVRKQLVRQKSNQELFSLNEEIKYVLDILSHKALTAKVALIFRAKSEIKIMGDPIRFNQIALNLISNAIDAYEAVSGSGKKEVLISLAEKEGKISLEVEDQGSGISEANINKIFEPFFTTKEGTGIGIGLSMAKRIVEKEFGGQLVVSSKPGEGSVFTLELPNTNEKHQERN